MRNSRAKQLRKLAREESTSYTVYSAYRTFGVKNKQVPTTIIGGTRLYYLRLKKVYKHG